MGMDLRSGRGWAGVLLVPALWSAARASGMPLPRDFRDCRDNGDCVAVAEDCCPADSTAGRTAIARKRLAEYRVLMSSACADVTALKGTCAPASKRRLAHESSLRPSCQFHRCCLIEDLPIDEEVRKDLAAQDSGDAAWLEGLRRSAVMIKDIESRLAAPGLKDRERARLKKKRAALLSDLDRASAANETNYLAQLYLGQVFLGISEDERALACASRSAAMAPKDARTLVLKGLALHKLGRNDAAAQAAKEALRLDPEDRAAQDLTRLTSGPGP